MEKDISSSVASNVLWGKVCSLLDAIQRNVKDKKKEALISFINIYKKNIEIMKVCTVTYILYMCLIISLFQKKAVENGTVSTDTFFPVMRILLPSLDRLRGAYGVKEKKLADLYIKVLGLRKDSSDAQKLLHYR